MKTDIGQFAIVPLWLARKVSAQALKTWVALAARANDQSQAWPSIGTICADVGDDKGPASENTIRAHLRELRDAQALGVSPRQREDGSATSNMYTLFFADPAMRAVAPTPATDSGGLPATDNTPPLQKTEGAEELDPSDLDKQPERLNELRAWQDQVDPICWLVYETLLAIPRFAPKAPSQLDSIDRLVCEYLALAPARASLVAEVGTFRVWYTGERCKRKYSDGVACLRNWWAKKAAPWAMAIQRQAGRTAQDETVSVAADVISDREELLRKAKAIRTGA